VTCLELIRGVLLHWRKHTEVSGNILIWSSLNNHPIIFQQTH